MNTTLYKYSVKAAAVISALFLGLSVASCSDDDAADGMPIDSPKVENADVTAHTLRFSWDKVNGAVQYGYELTNPKGTVVAANVTTATSVLFSDLEQNTTYTLKVWAFSSVTDSRTENSLVAILTGTTLEVRQLATPEPVATVSVSSVTIEWAPVANAESYAISYDLGDGEVAESVTECTYTIADFPVGEYTFSVTATSSDELWDDSEAATVSFSRTMMEIWRVDGTITFEDSQWGATMIAYDDGSYVIPEWFGYEGYNISFTVNNDATIHFIGCTSDDYYAYVYASADYPCYFYQDYSSEFAGNQIRGSWTAYDYYNGYLLFEWGEADEAWETDATITFGGSSWDVTLKYLGAGRYTIPEWYGEEGYDIAFTVNENGTLHFEDCYSDGYYAYIYATDGYPYYFYQDSTSSFSGGKDQGTITAYEYYDGTMTITWPATDDEDGGSGGGKTKV